MHSLMPEERRWSPRRRLYRAAKIKVGVGILAHDCILIDISERGVRLHIAGFDVPDEFVLLLSGDGVVRESKYRWSGGEAMKSAPSSSASSDPALACRISAGAARTAANFAKLPELLRREDLSPPDIITTAQP